ncbi:hypothetical protein M0R72_21800 [Candidatus Pacearchaeota archaeon]|jgi:hypothetical protein|nr:hypothetical protein [Candidatus Pacearchaeota archaeon]
MNKHIEAIEKALEHAKSKHPFFAHAAMAGWSKPDSAECLSSARAQLKTTTTAKMVSGMDVFACEIAEAQEAYSRGDYAHCLEELAQVGAVNIRMMEAVEEMMKGGVE